MHSFPAIVLQPGAQISLVQVEPFPSYALPLSLFLSTSLSHTFLSLFLTRIQSLQPPSIHSLPPLSPLFIFCLRFSLSLSLTSLASCPPPFLHMITEESRRPDKSFVATATEKSPPPSSLLPLLFSSSVRGSDSVCKLCAYLCEQDHIQVC